MNEQKTVQRVVAIGDIHGCAIELEALLQKLDLRQSDLVVFLGDYIDRGSDSRGVIDIILELKDRCEVVTLCGNHERMFMDFLQRPDSPGAGMFILNGGSHTLVSYAGPNGSFEIPESHLRFFQELKMSYQTETHYFVHAGVPDIPLAQIDEKLHAGHMLWIRHPFLQSEFNWEKMIVHGHTPAPAPELTSRRINVDTGCVYDGMLTAVDLDLGKVNFVQVEKSKKAEPPLFPRASTRPPIRKDISAANTSANTSLVAFPDSAASSRVAMRFQGSLPVVAGRAGGPLHEYETLNFNQFGLLLRDRHEGSDVTLQVGDLIEGTITSSVGPNGDGPEGTEGAEIHFVGRVVRLDSSSGRLTKVTLYGVQIDRITAGAEGRYWIKRP
jgi:serine/threonine protein phosphatase 1